MLTTHTKVEMTRKGILQESCLHGMTDRRGEGPPISLYECTLRSGQYLHKVHYVPGFWEGVLFHTMPWTRFAGFLAEEASIHG